MMKFTDADATCISIYCMRLHTRALYFEISWIEAINTDGTAEEGYNEDNSDSETKNEDR